MYGLKQKVEAYLSEKLLLKNRKALTGGGQWRGRFDSVAQDGDTLVVVCDRDAAEDAQAAMREAHALSVTVKQRGERVVVLGRF